jgi:two-component system sensor histidine kinase CpxA
MAEQIESLVNSQRQLLRDIAHELRSPLSRLYVALELARTETSVNGKKALERIELEASRLTGLIEGLLDLARLEGGALELQGESFDLAQLLKGVVEDAAVEAEAKGVRLETAAAESCSIYGSPNMVRSAVENVLRNAVHYAPEGSAVEVTLKCEEDEAEIVVRDLGPGVPEGVLDEIFTPFYRVGRARDRKTGGTGLGLSITRRIVNSHGGSVVAENHPGGGLSVTIRLPVPEVAVSSSKPV